MCSNVFCLNPKALFVGLETTLSVNVNSSWSLWPNGGISGRDVVCRLHRGPRILS